MRLIARQFSAFVVVGLVAAIAHYSVLIGLVEGRIMGPVAATLLGFIAGAAVSYLLNRRFSFTSERPHREAVWRFGVVSIVGFGLTGLIMGVLTGHFHAPYLPAQVLTTGIVLFWNFLANKFWTFSTPPVP